MNLPVQCTVCLREDECDFIASYCRLSPKELVRSRRKIVFGPRIVEDKPRTYKATKIKGVSLAGLSGEERRLKQREYNRAYSQLVRAIEAREKAKKERAEKARQKILAMSPEEKEAYREYHRQWRRNNLESERERARLYRQRKKLEMTPEECEEARRKDREYRARRKATLNSKSEVKA